MKKIFLTLLLSFIMLFSVTEAVTLTLIQPNGTVTLTRPVGSQITFKDLTNQIKWWKVIEGGVEVIDGGFIMPNNNVVVEAMYTGNVITVIQNEGGMITPGSVGVEENGDREFFIDADDGYTIEKLLIDGVEEDVTDESMMTYEFYNVTEPHTIEARYKINTHTIRVTQGTNGVIQPGGTQIVTHGSDVAFEIIANTGYEINQVIVDDVEVGNDGTYMFDNVTEDHTLTATFNPIEYNIAYNLVGGESTNPENYTIETETFTLNNPIRDGYTFVGWTGSNGNTPELTIMISKGSIGDRIYTANWTIDKHTITVIQNSDGTISPGTVEVDEGSSQIFTIMPQNSNYEIASLIVDDVSQPITNVTGMTYQFNNITEAHTIEATFKAKEYTITYELSGGTATNPTSYTVETETFTLNNPTQSGKTFTGWTGTGLSSETLEVSIEKGSFGDRGYVANWANNTYTIVATAGNGGTITPESAVVEEGQYKTFTIRANEGYKITAVKVDGSSTSETITNETEMSHTFSNVTANHTLQAEFGLVEYSITYELDGGEATNPESYTIETETFTLSEPTKDGYTFTGWTGSNGDTLETEVNIEKGSTGDKTYLANWVIIDTIELGEYVEYIPLLTEYETDSSATGASSTQTFNPSTTTMWRIISNDGTTIKLTTADAVTDTSGNGLTLKGETGHTNVVALLTELATAYENEYYTQGSSYPTAVTQLSSVGVAALGSEYWLASSGTSGYYTSQSKTVAYVNTSGTKADATLYSGSSYGGIWGGSWGSSSGDKTVTKYVRPEVTLKANTTFVSGTGSVEDPYKLPARPTYTIEVIDQENGTISPSTVSVQEGNDATFTITPNLGYEVEHLVIDNVIYDPETSYTFSNVTENHTITATYKLAEYTITYDLQNGELNGENPTTYNVNSAPITLINPTKGELEFLGWTGTGLNEKTMTVTIPTGSTGDRSYIANYEEEDQILLGEYVEYIPTSTEYVTSTTQTGATSTQTFDPSATTLWRIISNDGTTIKLTTADVVTDTSGTGLTLKGQTGKTNAVTTLTNLAAAFENTTYTQGSSYPTAVTELSTAGVAKLSSSYWLASVGNSYTYTVKYVNTSGSEANATLYSSMMMMMGSSKTVTNGVRPEVTLKDNTVFVSGTGSIDDPYKLTNTEVVKHQITVNCGAGGTITPGTTEVIEGRNQTFTITPYAGYEISSITIDGASQSEFENAGVSFTFENVTSTHTIEATFTPITYTITYSGLDGATINGTNPTEYTVETETFTLINPTKTDYTFKGWTGSNSSYIPSTNVTITKGSSTQDLSYTANWEAESYTITYDLAGGSVSLSNPTSYTAESSAITLNNPTRDGYTFAGWTGTGLAEATMTVTIPQGSKGARSYTATWTPITYTITYDLGGGTVEGINPTEYTPETEAFTLINPTLSGSTFAGWSGTGLTEVTPIVTISKGSIGNRNYTAIWTVNSYSITGTVTNGIGGTISPSSATVTSGGNKTFSISPQIGYKLTELRIDNSVQTLTETEKESGKVITFSNVTEDHTITATFTAISYSITYELNGGSETENPDSYTVESAEITLNNPTRSGYVFTGWIGTGLTEATMVVTIPTQSTGNRVYTANWVIAGDSNGNGSPDEDDLDELEQELIDGNFNITFDVFVDGRLNYVDWLTFMWHITNGNIEFPHTCGSYSLDVEKYDSTYHTVSFECNCGQMSISDRYHHIFKDGVCICCGETQLTPMAIYSETDTSLTFLLAEDEINVGDMYNGKVVTAVYTGFDTKTRSYGTNIPWYNYSTTITSVTIEDKIAPVTTAYWFYELSNLTEINSISNLDTTNVTDMKGMFYGCSGLTELDVSGFDTTNVTNMSEMFLNCEGLTTLDVSGFDTTNVTDMSRMFWSCSGLTELDVSGFDTTNVTSMASMFYLCNTLATVDVSGFDTTNVTKMYAMFMNCSGLTELDVSGFDTTNVTSMANMFTSCKALTTVDVSGFDTTNVTSMASMFSSCKALTTVDVSGFDTTNVTSMASMFSSCEALTTVDVSGFDTTNVTSMASMFSSCKALTTVDVSGFDTTNVTNMASMFYSCSGLTTLDVSGFDTTNVTSMANMFYSCSGLTILDVSGFDTTNVTSMATMFRNCSGLTTLDVSGFDTTNVTSMANMFYSCSGLTTLDVSGFDTTNVTSMASMFRGCSGLTTVDVSGFDTTNVTSMASMFSSCKALTTVDVSGFDTTNVTSMAEMFWSCSGLTELDVSGFDTTNVTSMYDMFRSCSGLTELDVSGFDTTNVTSMSRMFKDCSNLILDCSSWNVNNVTSYSNFNTNAPGVIAPTWVN